MARRQYLSILVDPKKRHHAEHEEYRKIRQSTADMDEIWAEEPIYLLEIYCNPAYSFLHPSKSPLLVGAATLHHVNFKPKKGPESTRNHTAPIIF